MAWGVRPGEELLQPHRSHRRKRLSRVGLSAVAPALAVTAYAVLRLGVVGGLSAVAAGLVVGLIVRWVSVTYWVALGPDGARVHNGLRYRVFRPGPGPRCCSAPRSSDGCCTVSG